jgi:HlyD family secretion protein
LTAHFSHDATGASAMNTILRGAVLLVVALLGAAGGRAVDHLVREPQTEMKNALANGPAEDGRTPIHAFGSIQPLGGVVEVAVSAGLLPIRFHQDIKPNSWIKVGHELAYLEGYDLREREVAVIEAEIKAAERSLDDEEKNKRAALAEIDHERITAIRLGEMQIESLNLKIQGLEEKARLAHKQLEDVEGLQHDNTISRQQYEQLRAQADLSLHDLKYGRAERERARKELDMNTDHETVARRKNSVLLANDRARSQFPLEILRRKKELAEAAKERCIVRAPVDGAVLEITTRPGESAAGKALLKMGDTSQIYVLAEVYEDDRKRVHLEQKARIQGRGLPFDTANTILHGTVQRISPIVGGHKQSPLDPTYRENARIYEVWIKVQLDQNLSDEIRQKIRQFILQPVDVMIEADDSPRRTSVAESGS